MDRPVVAVALAAYQRHSGQFPDHLLGSVAHQQAATTTYTFDRAAARYPRFTLLQ
ncbi:MAG: hypothetical protein KGS61_14965 [Verrucomicrobia bacterium]|nr:hypothetical protein [Verrucomicrobiota bacterium]